MNLIQDLPSLLAAFFAGAVICLIIQLLIDLTKLTPARILVGLVVVGVLLYAVGIYDRLNEVFGYGVSVPLLGFGATIARGVKEAVDSTGLFGAFTGGLSASAGGISVALIMGTLLSLFFGGKRKRL